MKHLSLKNLLIWTAWLIALPSMAQTVKVVPDEDPNIGNWTSHTYTLPQGGKIGFGLDNNNEATFKGAWGTAKTISVPEYIQVTDKKGNITETYRVTSCGSYRYTMVLQGITSLKVPASVNYIGYLPKNLKELHLKNYIEPGSVYSDADLECIYITADKYQQFIENEEWVGKCVLLKEGGQPVKTTVHVSAPNTFGQKYLETGKIWNETHELTVTGELSTTDLEVFKNFRQLTKLDLSGAKMKNIPENFAGSGNLNFLKTAVLSPVHSIDKGAFKHCKKLQNIQIPAVDSLGTECFYNCLTLRNLQLPENVKFIGKGAFEECNALEDINFPESLLEIRDRAFCNTSLKDVIIPSQILTLSDETFSHCHKLANIQIPQTVEFIGSSCFYHCDSLKSITLPRAMTSMGNNVFGECHALEDIYIDNYAPPAVRWGGKIMGNCDLTKVKIHVPEAAIATYRLACNHEGKEEGKEGWKKFYTYVPLENPTSHVRINGKMELSDPKLLGENPEMEVSYDNFTSSNSTHEYSRGQFTYNGTSMLSLKSYTQRLGKNPEEIEYHNWNLFLSTLRAEGPMRADEVKMEITLGQRNWFFFTLPFDVKVKDIRCNKKTNFVIRTYDGQARANSESSANTWYNLTADSILKAHQGYIIQCYESDRYAIFPALQNARKNLIFINEDVETPLTEYPSELAHNSSWNLIGNPYPSYFDTRFIEGNTIFTIGVESAKGNESHYLSMSTKDDEYVLQPGQAFFVQRSIDHPSFIFHKEGRQDNDTLRRNVTLPMYAAAAADEAREVFNLLLQKDNATDRTRVVLNEYASTDYETNKDAPKFIAQDHRHLLIYTLENGQMHAINERPLHDGIIPMGIFAPEKGEYCISLREKKTTKIFLEDRKTEKFVELDEAGYTFRTETGTDDQRFVLHFALPTAIEDATSESVHFNLEGNTLHFNEAFTVYAADGKKVAQGGQGKSLTLPEGVYIVVCNHHPYKIVIRS